MNKRLIEELANLAHEQWSGWMHYMFEKAVSRPGGSITLSSEDVSRWLQLMNTEYHDLSFSEKESDRTEAHKMIEVVVKYIRG